MIIASTFNKGGVGKTTLAVHVAGILQEQNGTRNLLVDCVDQADAYYFFARREPRKYIDIERISATLSVINNPELQPLRKVVDFVGIRQYSH